MSNDRLPPYDTDAEMAVLGSLLIDGEAIRKISLQVEDFFIMQNQSIFDSCLSINDRNETINQITVAQELAGSGRLEDIGGVSYLSQLIATVPTSLHIESYAQIVSRLSLMRKLISASDRIAAIGYEADGDISEAISKAQEIIDKVFAAAPVKASGDIKTLAVAASDYYMANSGQRLGLSTGIEKLDSKFGGLLKGESIVFMGPTHIGKTELSLKILMNIGILHRAIMFSEEMTQAQVVHRMVARISQVPTWVIYRGEYDSDTAHKFFEACSFLYGLNLRIERVGTVEMMRVFIERYEPEFVVIDHIQEVKSRGNSAYEITGKVAGDIVSLAKDYDIPVLALSQINRDIYKDKKERFPRLNQARNSGQIEEKFDSVWSLYRPGYFKKMDGDDAEDNTTELWILKDRLRGKLGKITLEWDPDHECYKTEELPEDNKQELMDLIGKEK